jgi:multidrug efflux pump
MPAAFSGSSAIALVASWFVAVIFTPYIGVKLLPNITVSHNHDPHAVYETRGLSHSARHDPVVRQPPGQGGAGDGRDLRALDRRFGHVQQQFFPLSERPELFLQLRLPEGTAFGVTQQSVKKAEALLKDDKDIATYTAYVGQGSPRFWLGLNPQLPNEAFRRDRDRRQGRRGARADQGAAREGGRGRRADRSAGAGRSLQFRAAGRLSRAVPRDRPRHQTVRDIAYRVRDVVRQNDKVKDPHLDWNEQSPYLKLVVDQDRARALGLTPQDVSQALSMLISGAPVTTVRDGIEKVDVVARAVPSERLDLGHVGDLTVTSRNGVAVPLLQIAKIEYAHEEPILWRRNRDMAITVRGDVVDGVQAPDVTNQIWPKLQPIRDSLPPAYRIEMGGAIEESPRATPRSSCCFR